MFVISHSAHVKILSGSTFSNGSGEKKFAHKKVDNRVIFKNHVYFVT